MKVEIESTTVVNNYYTRDGYSWAALNLIEESKKYETFDYPLAGADLSYCWPIKNMKEFLEHVKRVKETDEKYPILLDDFGFVCDGRHRICKAILAGKETIKAIRFPKMPNYDSYDPPK